MCPRALSLQNLLCSPPNLCTFYPCFRNSGHGVDAILSQWEKMEYSMNGIGITGYPSGGKIHCISGKKIQMDQQFKCQN